MAQQAETRARAGLQARERLLESAYELFSRRGIRDVGIDELIERAGVAKATLYRHFPSKDHLVAAFLERREQIWTQDWLEAESARRADTPEERLLALFDLFDEWFRREDFEACSFMKVLFEFGPQHPVGRASVHHLENLRSFVARLAEEAGLRDPNSFAHSLRILMRGSIVAATEGDIEAAIRAKAMARVLIDQHR
jgi:AcrR family transcriptional regulator